KQTRDAHSRLKSRPPSEPPPPALPDLVGAASAVETAAPRVSEARLPAGLSLGSPATAAPPVDVDAPVDARAVNDAIDTAPPSHALTPPPLPPQPAEPQMTVPIDPSEAPTEIVVPETATSPTSKQVEVARPPATPARIEIATAVRKPDREPRLMRAFAIAFVVTGALAGLLFLLAPGRLPAPAAVLATQEADRLTLLTKLLDVPDRSERGLDTANVNIDEALKRADRLISEADASRDADEAKFWLRRALVLGLGDRRMGWAMTQLGTLYASPRSGPPDYATARVLWELSAAQGDPVAFCFLATLYEQGLGVPAQPAEALANYRRARANGGCRDVDAAIARLSSQGR
ncbi:MAG: tetratricopeptide repeat protein, partial [Hyphomicrobiaceae bacterium]